MAKGLRSSTKKANRAKLRSKVFGPIEAARVERLSLKLLELAQTSTDDKADDQASAESKNQVSKDRIPASRDSANILDDSAMEIDGKPSQSKGRSNKILKRKKGRGHARNAIVFPSKKNQKSSNRTLNRRI